MPATTTTTVTRYVGKCPICEAEQKLTTDALPSRGIFGDHQKMVHHAFARPGDGEIHGGCYAVGAPPYEVSCEITIEYRAIIAQQQANCESYLAKLEGGEILELTERSWRRNEPPTIVKSTDVLWPITLRAEISKAQSTIRSLAREVARLTRLVDGWKLSPLRTVEEFEAPKAAEKAAAKAARENARAAKVQAKIVSYQKRIDSAVRNHTSSSIASIFESCQRAAYDLKMTQEQVFAAIDRNSVFAAFGLDVTKSYNEAPNRELLGPMSFDWDKTFVWPATL